MSGLEAVAFSAGQDPAKPAEIEAALERGLSGEFCHDADAWLSLGDRSLCSLADAARARCPGFAAACSGGDAERGDVVLPSALGNLLTIAFWIALAVAIALLLHRVVQSVLEHRSSPQAPGSALARPGQSRLVEMPAHLDAEQILAEARALAAAGHHAQAMALALGALLRGLERRGRLTLHASYTNGDYARRLRQDRALCSAFRAIADEVEAVQFGMRKASGERFAHLHARITRLLGPGRGGATLVLVIAAVLPALACNAPAASPHWLLPCGGEAEGHSALCELLAARDSVARKRFEALDTIDPSIDQLIVLSPSLEARERAVVLSWVEQGGRLLAAANLDELLGESGVVMRGSGRCSGRLTSALRGEQDYQLPRAATLWIEREHFALVDCDENLFAASVMHGSGEIVAVADARFFSNAALAIGDNALLASDLLGRGNQKVELIGPWTAGNAAHPARTLARARMLPWFLHGLLLLFALALCHGAPFGTRREVGHAPRRAFAEHARALGQAYARARASGLVLSNYGNWLIERLRHQRGWGREGIARSSNRPTSADERRLEELVEQVRQSTSNPRDAVDAEDEWQHLAVVRELESLVKQTGKHS